MTSDAENPDENLINQFLNKFKKGGVVHSGVANVEFSYSKGKKINTIPLTDFIKEAEKQGFLLENFQIKFERAAVVNNPLRSQRR